MLMHVFMYRYVNLCMCAHLLSVSGLCVKMYVLFAQISVYMCIWACIYVCAYVYKVLHVSLCVHVCILHSPVYICMSIIVCDCIVLSACLFMCVLLCVGCFYEVFACLSVYMHFCPHVQVHACV